MAEQVVQPAQMFAARSPAVPWPAEPPAAIAALAPMTQPAQALAAFVAPWIAAQLAQAFAATVAPSPATQPAQVFAAPAAPGPLSQAAKATAAAPQPAKTAAAAENGQFVTAIFPESEQPVQEGQGTLVLIRRGKIQHVIRLNTKHDVNALKNFLKVLCPHAKVMLVRRRRFGPLTPIRQVLSWIGIRRPNNTVVETPVKTPPPPRKLGRAYDADICPYEPDQLYHAYNHIADGDAVGWISCSPFESADVVPYPTASHKHDTVRLLVRDAHANKKPQWVKIKVSDMHWLRFANVHSLVGIDVQAAYQHTNISVEGRLLDVLLGLGKDGDTSSATSAFLLANSFAAKALPRCELLHISQAKQFVDVACQFSAEPTPVKKLYKMLDQHHRTCSRPFSVSYPCFVHALALLGAVFDHTDTEELKVHMKLRDDWRKEAISKDRTDIPLTSWRAMPSTHLAVSLWSHATRYNPIEFSEKGGSKGVELASASELMTPWHY